MRSVLPALTLLWIALAGCGKSDNGKQFSSEEMAKMTQDRLKGIAADKALSDEEALKKYLESHPAKPMSLPAGVANWAQVIKLQGTPGYMIAVKMYDVGYSARTNDVDKMLKYERDSLKKLAEFVASTLSDFQGRQLQGISLQIYTSLIGEDKPFEVFNAIIEAKDLNKFQTSASGPADVGTVFDPRGPKVTEFWNPSKNDYPRIEYIKKK